MNVDYGQGKTKYGPGVDIILDGNDIATAIDAYLCAHNIHVNGPRTVLIDGVLANFGRVYVDPSGFVIHNGQKLDGRGPLNITP